MDSAKKCCCIVLNYNDSATTTGLLDKIKDYSVFDKIIVVDNCSPDDSYEVLKKSEDHKIKVIRTPRNGGYGYGNNYGIKYAREEFEADYALIVNPDVIFEEQVVSGLISIMDNNNNCAVASCLETDKIGNVTGKGWPIPTYSEYVFCTLKIMSRLLRIKGASYPDSYYAGKDIVNAECFIGSFLLVDIDKFLEIDGYDERMFLFCEETTLGTKIKNAGYTSLLDMKHSFIHMHSVSINKAMKRIRQIRGIFDSRLFYIEHYMKVSKFKLIVAKLVFHIAIAEERVKLLIKR